MRPAARGVEEKRLAGRLRLPFEPELVDAVMRDVHPGRVEVEQLDRAFANPGADHDDLVGPARRVVVVAAAKDARCARERRGLVEVLQVVEGHHCRSARRRDRHGDRVVHDVGVGERMAEGARPVAQAGERPQPLRRAALDGDAVGDDGRQRAGDTGGIAWHDRDVCVRSDAAERTAQFTDVALRATGDAWVEREEAERDPHPSTLARFSHQARAVHPGNPGQTPQSRLMREPG